MAIINGVHEEREVMGEGETDVLKLHNDEDKQSRDLGCSASVGVGASGTGDVLGRGSHGAGARSWRGRRAAGARAVLRCPGRGRGGMVGWLGHASAGPGSGHA
jgi:hypothetical protein